MRLLVAPQSRRILRWTERVLFACAGLFLVYCGCTLVDAWRFQRQERQQLERLLADRHTAKGETGRTVSASSQSQVPTAAAKGLIGRLEIPRLGLSAMVIEGISWTTLRRGVGHIPGTELPGRPGNVGIAGHRDTFFRPLRNIRANDIITLTTLRGEYRYRVLSTKVVGPDDVAVLNAGGREILTLVTCYPFYFVGPAPDRFIVRAERIT